MYNVGDFRASVRNMYNGCYRRATTACYLQSSFEWMSSERPILRSVTTAPSTVPHDLFYLISFVTNNLQMQSFFWLSISMLKDVVMFLSCRKSLQIEQ